MNLLHPTSISRTSADLSSRRNERPRATDTDSEAARLRELGSQVARMAHDLNNLLSPILMSLEVFRPHLTKTNHQALLDIAKKSTVRAAELVRHVLAFSRGAEEEGGEIDPRAIVEEIGAVAQSTFPGSIGVRVDAPKHMPRILGNATQIHRALLNLCTNARDAMPEGGTLTLRASNVSFDHTDPRDPNTTTTRRYVLFEVRDTGDGIPEHIREKICTSFFTTKAPGKGTGLGLASVRSIVEKHDGVLSLQTQVGRGTTFYVLIPAVESAAFTTPRDAELRIVAAWK
ncbi:histidine kinase [Chthoniobacter flavus Ellin428]|uniref:histidine kinase n=1 Tax=Chthoniobacter flavus Ellin428 TaxID=497964 RepID=B4DCR0_9BACT|nr:ATP-binding protein [Chthoniobacter flavus]EDY15773.1 histidine kinase [Chthoniobacter flavus Ellin428]TCO89270.1 phospho-acceptor domain-containing protein [Chthoniobacter flavus]